MAQEAIEYVRDTDTSAADEARRLLLAPASALAICGPIEMELLSGARDTASLEAPSRSPPA